MYEHMRNMFAAELAKVFKNADIDIILANLDRVAVNYDVTEKTTALTVWEDSFPQIAKTYIAVKSLEGLSELTLKNYKSRLRNFFDSVGKQPQDVTANDVRMFLVKHKAQNNVSDRTLDKVRQILKAFFTWAVDEEYLTKNPCRNIKEIKFEITPRMALTRLQLEQLRRACRTKREKAIIDVLYSTGCRVSELVRMKKSDIDVENRMIHIVGKGRKHNDVYLNSSAVLSLDDYFAERQDDSEFLFVSDRRPHDAIDTHAIQNIFGQLSQIVGFKVTPHVMRHTTATLAVQSGMQITEVQEMLGHASVATTQIYAEILKEDVRQAHLKYVV